MASTWRPSPIPTGGPRCELDPAPLAELDDWLAPYRRFWDARLDDLGRHLDQTSPEE
jgi:hypothetical protein